MSVFWTRARHAELGDTVLPAAAVESYPGWEAVGEPSTDDVALRRAITADQAADAELADLADEIGAPPPVFPPPTASVPKTGADAPESSAPAGADPKE